MFRKVFTLGVLGMAFFGAAGSAWSQPVIDNFSLAVQPMGGTDYLTVGGAMSSSGSFVQNGVDAVGGRRVYYGQKTNGDTNSLQLGITQSQEFRMTLNPVVMGDGKLLYGFASVSNASLDADNYTVGHTFANLNLNFGMLTNMQFDYSLGGVGSTGTATISLISGTGASQQVANATLAVVSGSATNSFVMTQFVANNPSINFGDIDQIVVSLDGITTGVGFSLDNIRVNAVPEPASLCLLGVAGLGSLGSGYFSRRRQRRLQRQSC